MNETLPATRLAPRWILPARLTWIGITFTTLAVFVATLPVYYANLQVICLTANCPSQRLSVAQAQAWSNFGWSLSSYAALFIGIYILFGAVFLAAGALIFVRRSDDWLALFVSLMLITFGLVTFPSDPTLLAGYSTFQLLVLILTYFGSVGIFGFFAIFPSGRPVSRWHSLLLGLWAVWEFFEQIVPDLLGRPSEKLPLLNSILFLLMIAVSIFAQIYRYRFVSTARERQQTKWVVYGTSLGIGMFFVLATIFGLVPATDVDVMAFLIANILLFLALMFIPVSITFAMLHSHLWDVDIIIRRTLVYSILTGLLALIYFGGVVLVQQLTRSITETSDLAIVVSTLVIAALFFPLRRRVQNAIDRRFYRRKYDAAKTLAAFSATVRDEVELEKLTTELLKVVNETMQPASVSVWLKPTTDQKKRTIG